MGPGGPRWARCWPHELCYKGSNNEVLTTGNKHTRVSFVYVTVTHHGPVLCMLRTCGLCGTREIGIFLWIQVRLFRSIRYEKHEAASVLHIIYPQINKCIAGSPATTVLTQLSRNIPALVPSLLLYPKLKSHIFVVSGYELLLLKEFEWIKNLACKIL